MVHFGDGFIFGIVTVTRQRGRCGYLVQLSHVLGVVDGKRQWLPYHSRLAGAACESNGNWEELKWSFRDSKWLSVTKMHEMCRMCEWEGDRDEDGKGKVALILKGL